MLIKRDQFCNWVENFRRENSDSYVDSVVEACRVFNVEEGLVKDLLNEQITKKLEAEAMDRNIIRRTHKSLKAFV